MPSPVIEQMMRVSQMLFGGYLFLMKRLVGKECGWKPSRMVLPSSGHADGYSRLYRLASFTSRKMTKATTRKVRSAFEKSPTPNGPTM